MYLETLFKKTHAELQISSHAQKKILHFKVQGQRIKYIGLQMPDLLRASQFGDGPRLDWSSNDHILRFQMVLKGNQTDSFTS